MYNSRFIQNVIGDMEIVGIIAVDADDGKAFLTPTTGRDPRPRSYVTAETLDELRDEIRQAVEFFAR